MRPGRATLWSPFAAGIIAALAVGVTTECPSPAPRVETLAKKLPSPGNDPLDDSRMSFGQHLDELRTALWKAVVALFLGFLVGLLVGKPFIRFVNEPLEAGLRKIEAQDKLDRIDEEGGELSEAEEQLKQEGRVPEQLFLDSEALIGALESLGVQIERPTALPDKVPLRPWSEPSEARLMATAAEAGFSIYVRASFVVGAVIASPFVFYFLWNFVAAGLYPHEKKYVHIFLPLSVGLFLLGAIVAFYLALQFVIGFLLSFNAWLGIETTPRINEWLGFVLILPLGFGVAFQLPLVMLFLERIGVFSVQLYLRYWRYAVLVIFILSMFLTPADPQSMIIMALPLCLLYVGGIGLCKFLPLGKKTVSTTG